MYSFEDINDQCAFFTQFWRNVLTPLFLSAGCIQESLKDPLHDFNRNFKFNQIENRAKKRADQSKADSNLLAYKKHKNKLKCQAKLDYLQTSFAQSKSHPTFAAELWSHINGVLN